jgi:hypothetical protein
MAVLRGPETQRAGEAAAPSRPLLYALKLLVGLWRISEIGFHGLEAFREQGLGFIVVDRWRYDAVFAVFPIGRSGHFELRG